MKPGPGEYEARLDMKGWRVLCGDIGCGVEIAVRVLAVGDSSFHLVCFPPGWTAPRGVWFKTRHARKRVAKGRRSLDRRGSASVDGVPVQSLRAPTLPIKARCPRCWALNVLEHQSLDTDPEYPKGEFMVIDPERWENWAVEGDYRGTLPKR